MQAPPRVEITLRVATSQDVLDGLLNLKKDVFYYVKSVIHPDTFCGPLATGAHTDKQEFSAWFKQKRVYVPAFALDQKITLSSQLPVQQEIFGQGMV